MEESNTPASSIDTKGIFREYLYFTLIILFNILFYYVMFEGFIGIIGKFISIKPAMQDVISKSKQNLPFDIVKYLLIYYVIVTFSHLFFMGYIKGNGIKINNKQFPKVYEILEKQSKMLGFKKVPTIYLINGEGALNAFATRFAMRNYIVIYSLIFELAYKEGEEALEFIIGHELGHLKRGHVSFFNRLLLISTIIVPFLNKAYSRACEYSCDRIGKRLCPSGAVKGLLLLSAGTELFNKIEVVEYLNDSKKDRGFATWLYSIFSTHPIICKRIEKIYNS
jgi:Zn-dependent protease with chaperone function